jgi:hypothetical protein
LGRDRHRSGGIVHLKCDQIVAPRRARLRIVSGASGRAGQRAPTARRTASTAAFGTAGGTLQRSGAVARAAASRGKPLSRGLSPARALSFSRAR